MLAKCKAYDDRYSDFGGLTVPSKTSVSLISLCENVFMGNFETVMYKNLPRNRLVNLATESDVYKNLQISENCRDTILKLIHAYFKMRIHHALKRFNVVLKQTKRKQQNKKLLKVSCL